MNAVDVHIRGVVSGQIRAGSTVGEALEQLSADIGARALAALVNGREVDLATPLPAPEDGRSLEIEPVLPGTPEGLEVWGGRSVLMTSAARRAVGDWAGIRGRDCRGC